MARRWQYPSWALNDPEGMTKPEVTTPDKWWQPFSEPVLRHAGKLAFAAVIASGAIIDSEILTQPETTSLDKWFSPLSEPVRVHKSNPVGVVRTSFEEPEFSIYLIPEELAWFRPLVSIISRTSIYFSGPHAGPVPAVVVEEITLDEWYSPLVEPVRVKARASTFPEFVIDTQGLTEPEVTSLDKWYRPLSEFLYDRKRIPAALEPASVIDVDLLTQPEETLVSKWVPQTNEPVRVKKGLLTALQEAYFPDSDLADIPPAEEITLDKWYQPHSEPVLVKTRASEFPTSTNDTEGLTQPEVTSLDKWFVALSGLVRVQPTSLAGLISGAVYVGEPSDVEPLAEFLGWFKGLDEPVLPLVLPISNYPAPFFENEVSELDPAAERLAWYVDLSTPTLPKVRVAEFPAFITDADSLTRPETTTLDRWWKELSEPIRTQPISLAALISGEVQVREPSDLDPAAKQLAWYRKLDLPTLPKPRVAEFPAFVIDAELLTLPETITIDKWYVPLEEPVRIGDRLVVPFRLPAQVGERLPDVAALPPKVFISKEADQTHVSKEADQTHISKEADQTKDSKRC